MIAETPDDDVISDVLRGVRLTGSIFMDGRFRAPFGVISPARWDPETPIARLKHCTVFHLVAAGQCTLEAPDGERRNLTAGDMVLLPFTREHRFWAGTPEHFAYGPDLVEPGVIAGLSMVRDFGGDGEETRLVCGYLESAELMPTPLFRSLPSLIVERASDDSVSSSIALTATAIMAQLDGGPSPGVQIMLSRLMELLFVEILRRHAARAPGTSPGLFAASRDPLVSRALKLLHSEPARKWTVEALAREAGASRTVLGERFARLLGMAPIEYLTGWRMQLACEKLRAGRDGLARVAAEVGYESEAAFSRAFSRVVGCSPAAWRRSA